MKRREELLGIISESPGGLFSKSAYEKGLSKLAKKSSKLDMRLWRKERKRRLKKSKL